MTTPRKKEKRTAAIKLPLGACGAAFTDGFLITSQGLIFVMAAESIPFTPEWMSLIAAAYVTGSFLGSFAFGHLADRFGRVVFYRTFPWLIAAIGIFQFLSYSNLSWCLSRFAFGLMAGGDSPVSQAILFECSRGRKRAQRLVLLMNAWFVGAVVSAFSALVVVKLSLPWQYFAGLPFLLGIFFGLIRWDTPESVAWLRSQVLRRRERRMNRKLAGTCAGKRRPQTFSLWSSREVKNFLFLSVFWFCQALPVTVLLMFGPTFLSAFEGGSLLKDIEKIVVTDTFFLIGSLSALYIIPRYSRKDVIVATFLFMGSALFLLSMNLTSSTAYEISFLICYALAYGIQSVLDYVYPSELFPTEIRSTALGLLGSVSRIGVFAAALGFPMAFERFGLQPLLLSGAAVLFLGALTSAWLAPSSHSSSLVGRKGLESTGKYLQ